MPLIELVCSPIALLELPYSFGNMLGKVYQTQITITWNWTIVERLVSCGVDHGNLSIFGHQVSVQKGPALQDLHLVPQSSNMTISEIMPQAYSNLAAALITTSSFKKEF